jgi:putative ABC transport system ATP-binding protein
VLLADEPTGSLDPAASAIVLTLLDELRSDHGTAVLMVTHDPLVAARADVRWQMDDGVLRTAS